MQELKLSPITPLVRNLERFVRLSGDDYKALRSLENAPLIRASARTEIAQEGTNPEVVRLMVSGWATRYKDMSDGRRQIVGFFIPGDFCDLNVYILRRMDHSIAALDEISYLALPPGLLEQITVDQPRVAKALLWHELVSSSIMREWLLNLGQRSAFERLAHLFTELFVRMEAIGEVRGASCHFPATQVDLAEATGLTPVHVNRTLQEMRREKLIALEGKRLSILDFERLRKAALFNAGYLHLDHEGSMFDAHR